MNWQLLLIISILTTSGMTLLQRVLVKKENSDPVAYAIVFQLVTAFIIGFCALVNGFKLPDFSKVFPNVVIMPILWGMTNVFSFKALKHIEASEYTILYATRAIWTIIAALAFLSESFSLKQFIGTLLILLSVVFVSWSSKKFTFRRGSMYTLFAAMTFGFALINDSFIVQTADVPSYFSLAFLLPGLLIWLVYPSSTKSVLSLFQGKAVLKMAILGLFTAVTSLTYFYAYQIGKNAAQLASINQTSTVITVLLAIFLLREKSRLFQKISAAVLSFVGALLVV